MTKRGGARFFRALLAGAIFGSLAAPEARAEGGAGASPTPVESDARARASQHFRSAAALVREGRLNDAAAEFEKAYELSPHFATLYNLGQAYLALDRPRDAVENLTRYLEEGGTSVGEAQRKRVESQIQEQRARLSLVTFEVEPADARLTIDEKPIARSERGTWLVPGAHDVRVEREGYVSKRLRVELKSGTALLSVHLEKTAMGADPTFGVLHVHCELPGVRLKIPRQNPTHPLVLGESGPATVVVPSGRHALVFERAGYASDEQLADVRAGETTRIACRLRPLENSRTGMLSVSSPLGAEVRIDGQRASALRLPPGPHGVTASFGDGSARFHQTVNVHPGRATTVVLPTTKVPDRSNHRRTLGWAVGGAGLVLNGAALGTFLVSSSMHAKYEREQSSLDREFASGNANAATDRRQRENDDRAQTVRTLDTSAAVLLGAGATMVVGGILMLVLEP